MEQDTQKRRRGSGKACKRKRRIASSESSPSITPKPAEFDTLFSLLLAALSKAQTSPNSIFPHLSLIKKCLRKVRLALLSGLENPMSPFSQGLPVPILSLLPVIIKSRYGVSRSEPSLNRKCYL